MMGKYLNYFDECFYINRIERTDRKEAFLNRCKEFNLEPILQEAIVPPKDYVKYLKDEEQDITRAEKISNTLSHLNIVRIAKEKQFSSVLIFEDDCLFLEGFDKKLSRVVADLHGVDWDILYLGGEPNNYMEQVTDNLFKMSNVGGIYCLHCYAIHHTFYDTLLSIEANEISCIDTQILNMQNSFRKIYASAELLAVQDYTWSDIWHYHTNSSKIMFEAWDKYIKNGIKLKK